MPNKRKDYSGQRFGKLTAIKYHDSVRSIGKSNHLYSRWLCKCDCGNEIIVRSMRFGTESRTRTLSCGCVPHGNRKYTPQESSYRQHYWYHSRTCNNDKWGKLTYQDWRHIVLMNCVTCNKPPRLRTYAHGPDICINGIDRIDSTKGYILSNIQPMCTWCNIAKGTCTTEEFISNCKAVSTYNPDTSKIRYWPKSPEIKEDK